MWYILDLNKKQVGERVLGRLASKVAKVLTGKNLPNYTAHLPGDNYVVVTGVELLEVTGGKEDKKEYIRHSGFPGGIKKTAYKDMFARDPSQVLYMAVKGMLPKNKLRQIWLERLKMYKGTENPHTAQQPVAFPESI